MPRKIAAKNKTIIEVKDLSVRYGATVALSNADFSVEKGDYVGLAGPNGAGKSSLIKAILGLVPVSSGSVKVFGQEMGFGFSGWRRIGYLPQTAAAMNQIFPATAAEAVRLGALAGKGFPRRLTSADAAAADRMMKKLNIHDLRDRPVTELSGGEQQRVFLARALVNDPELLILDEPSTGLDPEAREDFFSLVHRLNLEKGVTVIMITHDTGQIGHYAKKLLYVDKKVVFYGSFGDFCLSPEAEKKFGEFAHHLICHQHHDHRRLEPTQ